MKIKLSTGEKLEVKFTHETFVDIRKGKASWRFRAVRLHPKDEFSRVKGCKIALKRALEDQPRELRKEIWRKCIEKGMRVS